MKLKKSLLLCAILTSSIASISYAGGVTIDQQVNWNPQLKDQYHCRAGQYCGITGTSNVTIVNDTDDVHHYTYYISATSDAGQVVGNQATWQTNVTVQPHSNWTNSHGVLGYVKINNPGTREIGLYVNIGGDLSYIKTSKGWIYVDAAH